MGDTNKTSEAPTPIPPETTPPVFTCPLDCLAGIGEVFSGQYDFPGTIQGNMRILDIGANVGAFSLWARRRFPDAEVIAYEPHPVIYEHLRRNTAHDPKIHAHRFAVGDPDLNTLYDGIDTRLCNSMHNLGRQSIVGHNVQVIDPRLLPEADFVKIDTEGSEGFIVEFLDFVPALLVVEFHTEELRQRIERALNGHMELIDCQVLGRGWGHAKYIRRGV